MRSRRTTRWLRAWPRDSLELTRSVCAHLDRIGRADAPDAPQSPKSAANFVLFELGSAELASYVYAGLKDEGLLVRYWGSRPDLCTKLRVTVGTRESNERFVTLVTKLLADAPPGKKQKLSNGA